MKDSIFTIENTRRLTENIFEMTLSGDTGEITAPGQFVNIALSGRYLRRPISVCDLGEGRLTLVYKVVGAGTEQMRLMNAGEKLDLLTGLGNGYDLESLGSEPLLIGGGAGVPPMYYLAKRLIAAGKKPQVVLGFNTKTEIFYEEEFRGLGVQVYITTVDGSAGTKGFVTDAMAGLDFDCTCACGPEPMLKAVYNAADVPGQFSFERRMGCGFGACMGCSCRTKYGFKRICRDGPVLTREEIIW